jgi:hypothetical protein
MKGRVEEELRLRYQFAAYKALSYSSAAITCHKCNPELRTDVLYIDVHTVYPTRT